MDASTTARWASPATKLVRKSCFIFNERTGSFPAFISDLVVEREALSGYRGRRIPNAMHPCIHTKERWIGRQITMNSGADRYKAQDVPRGLGGSTPLGMEYSTAMGADGAATLRSQLAGNMTPAVSLPVFAIELPQTLMLYKQIFKAASNIVRAIGPKVASGLGARLLHNGAVEYVPRTRRARNFIREAANVHLMEAFGVQPLIQDIMKMWNTSSATHEHLKRLKALDKDSWSPFSAGYTPSSPMTLTPFVYMSKGSVTGLQQEIIESSLGCRVHAQIRPNGPLPQDAISKFTNDYLGLRSPFSVLWELKSFSFVLDWVLPVGDIAQNLDSALQHWGETPFLQTRRLCWTSMARATRNFTCSTYYTGQPQFLGTLIQSEFRRGLGLPVYEPRSISAAGIGMNQVALSTSLIIQKLA